MAARLDTVTVPRPPLSPTGPDVDLIVDVPAEHSSKVIT
jgi:proline-rich tail region repeat protein